jgi:1-aminocyclopropane-1-carboxylate deaminase/D-cysteine desulfhydrase-like pyridoxal-dependent ACC family enzyme
MPRPISPAINTWNRASYTPQDLAEVANATAALLGLPHRLTAADIDIRDDYIGERYGVVTPGCREALALLARTEGILLDPVYTGKAMAGLIDDARHGRLGARDQIVFIHTGGSVRITYSRKSRSLAVRALHFQLVCQALDGPHP